MEKYIYELKKPRGIPDWSIYATKKVPPRGPRSQRKSSAMSFLHLIQTRPKIKVGILLTASKVLSRRLFITS